MRIQHVGLVVSDLERSRRFYRDALGLEEVPRPPNFTFAGAWFRFFLPRFHPWNEDDRELLRRYEASAAAVATPAPVKTVRRARKT